MKNCLPLENMEEKFDELLKNAMLNNYAQFISSGLGLFLMVQNHDVLALF